MMCSNCLSMMIQKRQQMVCPACGAVMEAEEENGSLTNLPEQARSPGRLRVWPFALAFLVLGGLGAAGYGYSRFGSALFPGAGAPDDQATTAWLASARPIDSDREGSIASVILWQLGFGTDRTDELVMAATFADFSLVLLMRQVSEGLASVEHVEMARVLATGEVLARVPLDTFATSPDVTFALDPIGGAVVAGTVDGQIVTERYDTELNFLWRTRVPDTIGARDVTSVALMDGMVAVLGFSQDKPSARLTVLYADGEVNWKRDFPSEEYFATAKALSFGPQSLIVAVATRGADEERGFAISRIGRDGTVAWRTFIPAADDSRLQQMEGYGESWVGLLISGASPRLIQLDATGAMVWTATPPAFADSEFARVSASPTGDLVLAASHSSSQSSAQAERDIWIGRYDAVGSLIEETFIGLVGDDRLKWIDVQDDRMIIGGDYTSRTVPLADVFVIALDPR